MGNLFNMDNKFFSAMGRVADLIILNLLTILCCIPIVTIGPAVTAMYYTTMKMARNEESYIVRGYFHSFKENLKQGILINLVMLIAGIILAIDLYIVNGDSGTTGRIMFFIFLIMVVFYLFVYIYIYPVLAKFYNTVRNTFRNAVLMSIRHLPYTLLMFVITLLPVAILFIPVAQLQSIFLMLFVLMGPALIAFAKSYFLVKIFDNYIPKEEEEPVSEELLPEEPPLS